MSTLTTANSVFSLTIAGLYPAPQLIQGYAVDDQFAFPNVKPVETMMGVDGKLSGGYTPYPTNMEITLQADSISNFVFDDWLNAMRNAQEVYIAGGTVIYPAIARIFTFTRGFLEDASPMPTGKKVLQPRKFQITWESVTPAPY